MTAPRFAWKSAPRFAWKSAPRFAGLLLAARVLLTIIYARAIDGLVPAPLLIAVLVAAHLTGRLAARTRLRTPVVTMLAAAGFLGVRAALLAVMGAVAGGSASVSLSAFLQELDAGSVAALPVLLLGWAHGLVAVRHPKLARWAPIVHGLLLLALLWSQAHYELTYFARPWAYVLIVGLLLVTDAFLLVDLARLERRALVRTAALLAPIVALALLLAANWYSAGGTSAGGGILRPTLFRFDFAPFVQLESEITMSDDLVLLYRRSGRSRRELLRRYVLTEYDARGGFSVAADEPDGRVAAVPENADGPEAWRERELVEQEYFLVNLDPETRLALNEPVAYQPFRVWDDSSFTAAYAAESLVSTAPPFRLATAGSAGLSEREFDSLTDYGDREELRELALEIVDGVTGDFARARAIELYLQENYFYSLRPGIAADGDQLAHFLFESRKGYCSYYAFSMALMARSLGIPARVAVGFFVDPGQEVLNFYPVLANMAHAWVEVYLGAYGWVEFDPTSQTLAPGEEYEFGAGADPNEIARLLEEILAQDLEAAREPVTQPPAEPESGRLPEFVRSIARRWYLVLPLLYALYLGVLHLAPVVLVARARSARERIRSRSRLVLDRLSRHGLRRREDESLREFGLRLGLDQAETALELYERSLFAPRISTLDDTRSRDAAVACLRDLRRRAPWWRRLLAVLDPRPRRRARSGSVRTLAVALLLSVAALLQPADARAQQSPDWYREQAREAIRSERYDRAVDLLTEAQREHGATSEFFVRLGDLYYDEELYGLALDEYLEAEERDPASYEVLEAIAFTLGLLNREDESAEYWFRIADLHPERIEPYQNLGWLLFKLHRLEEGRELALDAWDRFGPDADLAMTLGTIHAELYRFPEASSWYRRSIELASANESSSFVAVAFYNLSLIQKLFHRYEAAL
ncbi:MAG: transglutaminase domain-containing protein, partial [Spirochaetota bacterium]